MSSHSRQFFEFGHFRLDVTRTRLTRNGELVSLPPKAVTLLTILMQHQGRAVEKEELIETMWPNMMVEDSNLTQTVHILRKTLKKYSDVNITIETLPRFGYRLILEVRECNSVDKEQVTQPSLPVTYKSEIKEDRQSTDPSGDGFFHSLQKNLLLWLQKRREKLSVE